MQVSPSSELLSNVFIPVIWVPVLASYMAEADWVQIYDLGRVIYSLMCHMGIEPSAYRVVLRFK